MRVLCTACCARKTRQQSHVVRNSRERRTMAGFRVRAAVTTDNEIGFRVRAKPKNGGKDTPDDGLRRTGDYDQRAYDDRRRASFGGPPRARGVRSSRAGFIGTVCGLLPVRRGIHDDDDGGGGDRVRGGVAVCGDSKPSSTTIGRGHWRQTGARRLVRAKLDVCSKIRRYLRDRRNSKIRNHWDASSVVPVYAYRQGFRKIFTTRISMIRSKL